MKYALNNQTSPAEIRHFLDLTDIEPAVLRMMIDEARRLKEMRGRGEFVKPLADKKLAMIFEKNSTRTHVSFEVAMMELGGQGIYLNGNQLQLGRGESIADTARVLSRYVDGMLLRTHNHAMLTDLAAYATVPVINGLTQLSHPCQLMADIMTYEEHRGAIAGKTVAWLGDGNNVANSWIMAAQQFEFALRLACPAQLQPDDNILTLARARGAEVTIVETPQEAAKGAHIVTTDTWVSMGDKDAERRMALLAPYQVNDALMALASKDAVFMHCLPVHRGEEVTASVIDGAQSVVWDEAENRLHAQKAILLWCFGKL